MLILGVTPHIYLSVKRIVVKQVCAVELLAVCLGHTNDVLISLEYLNLENVSKQLVS